METRAHRSGPAYSTHPDVRGAFLPADFGRHHWADCPELLHTSLDVQDVLQRWQRNLGSPAAAAGAECRLSDDAGHFLCDFIYFSSLAAYRRRGGVADDADRPVLFLHIPAGVEEEDVKRGTEATCALVRAMVVSWKGKKAGP